MLSTFMLVIALALPDGSAVFAAKSENGKPVIFKDKASCEKVLKEDKKKIAKEMKNSDAQWELKCVDTKSIKEKEVSTHNNTGKELRSDI